MVRAKRSRSTGECRKLGPGIRAFSRKEILFPNFRGAAVKVQESTWVEGPYYASCYHKAGRAIARIAHFLHQGKEGIRKDWLKVVLLPGQSAAEEDATLAQETAHAILHLQERRAETTKRVRETEAEAFEYVVCHAIGLETSSAAEDYIQLCDGDAKLLTESLEHIQRAAIQILNAIGAGGSLRAADLSWAGRPKTVTSYRLLMFRFELSS